MIPAATAMRGNALEVTSPTDGFSRRPDAMLTIGVAVCVLGGGRERRRPNRSAVRARVSTNALESRETRRAGSPRANYKQQKGALAKLGAWSILPYQIATRKAKRPILPAAHTSLLNPSAGNR